jgi:hypothetical protein
VPLPTSNVSIPLSDGLNLKVDSKDAPIGSMLRLENATMQNPGKLAKRAGWQGLTDAVVGGAFVQTGSAIAAFNSELFLFDGQLAYSWLPDRGWVTKGTFTGCTSQDLQVVRNSFSQQQPTCATQSGITGYSYLDSRGGCRCTVQDEATGNVLVRDAALDTSVSYVRAVAFAGSLLFFYTEGEDVKYQQCLVDQPTSLQEEVVAFGGVLTPLDGPTQQFFDVAQADGNLYFAWATHDGVYLAWLDASLSPHGPVQVSATVGCVAKSLVATKSGNLWLCFNDGASNLLLQLDSAGNVLAAQTFVSNPALSWGAVAMAEVDSQLGTVQGFFEVSGGEPSSNPTGYVVTAQWSATGPNPSYQSWLNGVQLASKPFVQSGQAYLCVQWNSLLQPGLYVVTADSQHRIVARDRYEALGFGIGLGWVLSDVPTVSPTSFRVPVLDGGFGDPALNSSPGTVGPGVGSFLLSFDPSVGFFNCQVDEYSFVATAAGIQSYDGAAFSEDNFFNYPESLEVAIASGGGLSAGEYTWAAIYTWTDNQGGVVRSSVSVPSVATDVPAGASAAIAVPTLRLTDRDPSSVTIEIYRSQANAAPATGQSIVSMNLVAQLQNTAAFASLAYLDTSSDADIASNQLLYVAGGGVIDYSPCDPGSQVVTFQNRVFVAGLSSAPNQLAFSNARTLGQPVTFNADNVIVLDSFGGDGVTAMGVLADQLIAFKERSVFRVWGTGPDSGGNNDSYSVQVIASNVGCVEPNSVVLAGSQGLLFKSHKGIYITDGSSCSYVGADVEPYNAYAITSANDASDSNQVRFTLDASSQPTGQPNKGVMVVWDYFVDKWMTYTGLDAADSCVWNGVHTLVKPNGQVWQEAPGTFDDPYGFFGISFELNEVMPFGPQGMFTLLECWLQGDYLGPHQLRVSFAFDTAPWPNRSTTVNATQVFTRDVGTYGLGGGTYGVSSAGTLGNWYGGLDKFYSLEFQPGRETHSVRVMVEEVQPPFGPSSGGLTVSSVSMKVIDLGRGPYLATDQMS